MRNRDSKHLTRTTRGCKWRVGLLNTDVHVLTLKFQAAIAKHGARQQSDLEQDLEAVADSDHRSSSGCESFHLSHDRRETRNRSRAQVIAMGEPARQDHNVGITK